LRTACCTLKISNNKSHPDSYQDQIPNPQKTVPFLKPYKQLNKLIQNESFEPMLSWGFRMGLSGTLPIVWGLATGRIDDAVWITLTAEAVSWVELKGSFSWRIRTLISGAILAVLFSVLGTITGNNLWLSVIGMFTVGFLASLLKNIGDRASGLAICVYLLFIICNAYPETNYLVLRHRIVLTAIGAAWPVFVGFIVSFFAPEEQPYRRQIALVWRAIATLIETIGENKQDDQVYLKEKEVRHALDNSYQFYGQMAHQVNKEDNRRYQLAMLRKIAGLVSVNVIAMAEEMEHIAIPQLDDALRIKAATLFRALNEATSRISVFVISLKAEEKLLAISHINRLKKLTAQVKQYPLEDDRQSHAIKRIVQLTERTTKLLDNALQRIEQMGNDIPVFRSYSLAKTLFVLKPKYFLRNIRLVFSFNTLTTRYAFRSAIAATTALFIYKWYHIDHGYWLPFSVMIVIQPYFGATFKKAIDRVAGTLLGGLAGGLLLHLPSLYLKEIILFITFILMVYYVRRRYSITVFVVTVNLVLLFNIESAYSDMILLTRALCTVGGAMLAVVSGFALLPAWDKKWLPTHLVGAIGANYEYFIATFFSARRPANWTRHKRNAESKNSDAFDSFNRYMQEPGKEKSELYYDLITDNIRICRNLNNIHLEQDEKKAVTATADPSQQKKINEAQNLFNRIMQLLEDIKPVNAPPIADPQVIQSPFELNKAQMISLEKLIIELKAMHTDLEKLAGKNHIA
jgi:uncharacterized membrane protein YccC